MRVPPTRRATIGAAPLDPARAARALEEARDREQIFSLLLRATCSRVPFAALLSVHRDAIRGRRAMADDRFDASAIGELTLPRDAVEAFEQVVATRAFYLGPIATGVAAIDAQLARLGGVLPRAAVVLPVVLSERTVALVVGHRGEEPVGLGDVAELAEFVPQSG